MPSYAEAMVAVRVALAAECGCAIEDFDAPTSRVYISSDAASRSPFARRYERREPIVNIVSMGAGTVVSGSAPLMPALRAIFADADRDAAFDVVRLAAVAALLAPFGLTVTAPALRLVCGDDPRRDRPIGAGVAIEIEEYPPESRLAALGPALWPHAFRLPVRRPNTRLAVASQGATVIGVAAMSEDSSLLWQIGIDVSEEFRGQGVGAALTSLLAREALRAGRVPFYAVAPSNIASVTTALAAGFRLGWVEAYSLPIGG